MICTDCGTEEAYLGLFRNKCINPKCRSFDEVYAEKVAQEVLEFEAWYDTQELVRDIGEAQEREQEYGARLLGVAASPDYKHLKPVTSIYSPPHDGNKPLAAAKIWEWEINLPDGLMAGSLKWSDGTKPQVTFDLPNYKAYITRNYDSPKSLILEYIRKGSPTYVAKYQYPFSSPWYTKE